MGIPERFEVDLDLAVSRGTHLEVHQGERSADVRGNADSTAAAGSQMTAHYLCDLSQPPMNFRQRDRPPHPLKVVASALSSG
jgi:hypothetical protein